jgi:hypothetical protein
MLEGICADHRGVAVAELVKPSAAIPGNPLATDSVLLDMYLRALDVVLAEPEIDGAFDEFGLSAATVRMKMVSDADRVLGSAPREFAAYQDAVTHAFADAGQITHGSRLDLGDMVRRVWIGAAVAGALMVVGGVASSAAWPWTEPLVWAGGDVLAVAAVLWTGPRVLDIDPNFGPNSSEFLPGFSLDMAAARDRLMAAVSEAELLAQVRTFINTARQGRFGQAYSVAGSPGLSEVYDSANRVSTEIEAELDGLLGRLDGASIGVAGPRGSGKSTLIRGYCEETGSAAAGREEFDLASLLGSGLPGRAGGDLRCVVAAPVDYVARDFVLHLFAAFCRAVIGRYGRKAGDLPGVVLSLFWLSRAWLLVVSLLWRTVLYGGSAAALLHWKHVIARWLSVPTTWVVYAAIAMICAGILGFAWSSARKIRRWVREVGGGDEETLAAIARDHLSRVRFLQTYTSGWSGTLSLPGGGAEGQLSRGVSLAEQPLSYPEIVEEFRNFARSVAADVHRRGDRVFIGVDELDKMGSAEQAEHFLNEIKGIFGIPHLYFMVSVSDDALTAFERRGLPLRDAFDSSFDEIIHVGPLSYAESRKLLYRRVIGLTEPYVALCHCLAGGLARDLIRAARQVVRTAATLAGTGSSTVAPDAADNAIDVSTARLLLRGEPADQPPALAAVSAAVIQDELHRKLRAVSYVLRSLAPEDSTRLQEILYDIAYQPALRQPAIKIVDLMAKPCQDEPQAVASLRLDFAAQAYYFATLQDVFTDRLDSERMAEATSETPGPGSFDALAAARYAFTLDTLVAWRSITQFRKAWSLDIREPVRRHLPEPG